MKKKFTTTLDADLIKQLKILAINRDTSVAALIEEATEKLIKESK